MKNILKTLAFALIFQLFACNPATKKQSKIGINAKTTGSLTQKTEANKSTPFNSSETENDEATSDCIRGIAEPIIKKNVFPNTTFKIQPDRLTAIETVNFDNGDRLIIKNWGCEYYVLAFRFETSRFQENTANIPFWFKKAVLLVSELHDGIDAPIDIKEGINKLIATIDNDQINNYQHLKLGDEIDFGGNDIRDFLTIDKIEKLSDTKFAIELSFSTGPL